MFPFSSIFLALNDFPLEGELAHRFIKRLYGLTNKKNAMAQIAKKYSRHQALRCAERQEEQEASSMIRFKDHHIISKSQNTPLPLFEFVQTNSHDPAIKVFNISLFFMSTG